MTEYPLTWPRNLAESAHDTQVFKLCSSFDLNRFECRKHETFDSVKKDQLSQASKKFKWDVFPLLVNSKASR